MLVPIDDIVYKILRRSLTPGLYRTAQRVLGRAKTWERIDTYEWISEKYRKAIPEWAGKTVVEVGPGNQIHTAMRMLTWGAAQVFLVDPKATASKDALVPQVTAWLEHTRTGTLGCDEALGRLKIFADMSDIPVAWNEGVDVIVSHVVLEHFHKPADFYVHAARLLGAGGISWNEVDLSDHTYHVLGKTALTRWFGDARALFHLRYSDRFFMSVLNDEKCYMNRVVLPEHRREALANGLSIASLETKRFSGRLRVHPDVRRRAETNLREELDVLTFWMTVQKR